VNTPGISYRARRLKVAGIAANTTSAVGATASAAGVSFNFEAPGPDHTKPNLAQVTATAWRGGGSDNRLGHGTLTLAGTVAFDAAKPTRNRLTFVFKSRAGELRGCVRNTILLRPGSRYVWDGPGEITSTSSALRQYRGLKLRIGGVTRMDDLKHARIELTSRAPGGRC